MVYNAMKLFMEVNPQLFDECSHEYTESQNNINVTKANRQAKWDRLAQLAESMKQNGNAAPVRPPAGGGAGGGGSYNSKAGSKVTSPLRQDDADPFSQESQQRMERLRLQDDGNGRERNRASKESYERHSNSVR